MYVFLPALGRLQSLKELYIKGMDAVEVIGSELLGTGGVAFPSFQIYVWVVVWSTNSGDVDAVFPCLQELYIDGCPKLVDISLEALPSLRLLKITDCGYGVLRSMVSAASLVTGLVIKDIAGLSDKVWRGVIKNLGAVEELSIKRCNKIRYMWESEEEASKDLVNLRYMEVKGCSNLVRLGEKKGADDCRSNLLTSLRMSVLKDCDNLQDCSCPSSIEALEIINCSSITCVSFPTGGGGGMQKLKLLRIEDCEELVMGKELLGGGENTYNTMLENSRNGQI